MRGWADQLRWPYDLLFVRNSGIFPRVTYDPSLNIGGGYQFRGCSISRAISDNSGQQSDRITGRRPGADAQGALMLRTRVSERPHKEIGLDMT